MAFRLVLVSAVVLYIGQPYYACAQTSRTLTLTLESPELSSSDEIENQSAASRSRDQKAVRKSLESEQKRVGLVGIVRVDSSCIYAKKLPSSRVFARVKSETPLAIVEEDGSWYGVLMVNGATGWIAKKNVRLTGYELVIAKSQPSRGPLASRGGVVDRAANFGEQVIQAALRYMGVPYVYGGRSTVSGMDCSAFVQMVFKQFGISLPRTSREQAQVGATVAFTDLKPGDRLYFACKNSHIDHCGIYAGNGYFVHCSAGRGGVGVDTLASDFYWRSLVVAKRS